MFKHCTSCGAPFRVGEDEDWKRLCLPCWVRTKRSAPPPGGQGILGELRLAQDEIKRLKASLAEERTRRGIPDDMMRMLILLCHPDRHSGSVAATKATAWLLREREASHG